MPTNFPNGVSSWGVPVLPVSGQGPSTGQVFFVDSVLGSAAYDGLSPARALATLNAAVTKCIAAKGDTIYLMPGHTETLIAAAGVALSKAGIRVIGLGVGKNRPIFNYSTAVGASFDVTAANVYVENIYFRGLGIDALTAMINVSAADVTFVNCEIEHGDATNQAVLALLTTAAADRLKLARCHFHGSADAGTAAAVRIVGGTDIVIERCKMIGAYTTSKGGVDNITTACVNLTVDSCIISNLTASSTVCVNLAAATTGAVVDCRLSILSGTAPIVGAALNQVGGNYYKAAAGVAAGTLL